jgi:paraquat-inducible protein A
MSSPSALLTCPLCDQEHRWIRLAPGQRALCVCCGSVLARGSRFGRDTALVFTITGLILAAPALFLPFITAGKFGQERGGLLLTSVDGLWDNGMRLLAIWVLFCGTLVPVTLLGLLASGLWRERLGRCPKPGDILARAAHAMSHWAMPEVQVLAVLVALMKLGSLVDVHIGPGFWCYAGMSVCLLVAWRSFSLRTPPSLAGGELGLPSSGSTLPAKS